MKVVATGETYKIYGDSMRTYNGLPSQCYSVRFSEMNGFYLQIHAPIEVDEKIYGVHRAKVEKVMNSFQSFNRNLGVILSGDKGIGKSLCAKMIANEAILNNYPVIIVNKYIPGIADYLASIEQEVLVLFDEFDKTFSDGGNRDNINDPQAEMLTLFDGLSQGKKLFVVTCNEIYNLNNYLINRPGRFHYHFRFGYPTGVEIAQYMQDKISKEFYGEIDKVISFSQKVPLNYDCLRAIAFELGNGSSFEDAIKDLNIINVNAERYYITAYFKDGTKSRRVERAVDLFSDGETDIELTDMDGYDFRVLFNPCDSRYDYNRGATTIDGANVTLDWEDCYYNSDDDLTALNQRKTRQVDCVTIVRKMSRDIHYAV